MELHNKHAASAAGPLSGHRIAAAWGNDVEEDEQVQFSAQVLGVDDLVRHICSFLPTIDCMAIGAVSRRFKRLARGQFVASLTIGRPLFKCSWASLFKTILYYGFVPQETADPIAQMLRGCTSLRELRVGGSVSLIGGRITSLGRLQPLCDAIKRHACRGLEQLSVYTFYPGAMTGLCRALSAGGCPEIRALELGGSPLSSRAGLLLKNAICNGKLPKLERLRVNGWLECRQEGMDSLLAGLLKGAGKSLRSLDLCWGIFDMATLAAVLYAGACPRLQTLRLAFASITTPGACLLAAALERKHLSELEHLCLSYNQFDGEGFDRLRAALPSVPKLRTLGLAGVAIGDYGLMQLSQVLPNACRQLTSLDLALCFIGADGAAWLAEALASSGLPVLEELNLAYNSIGPAGLKHLARGAKRWHASARLRSLVLCNCSLGDAGMPWLVGLLWVCPRLQHLNVASNEFDITGMWALIRGVQAGAGRGLVSLHVGLNFLGGWGAAALAGALDGGACPRLRQLDVTKCQIEPWGAKELVRAMARRADATSGSSRRALANLGCRRHHHDEGGDGRGDGDAAERRQQYPPFVLYLAWNCTNSTRTLEDLLLLASSSSSSSSHHQEAGNRQGRLLLSLSMVERYYLRWIRGRRRGKQQHHCRDDDAIIMAPDLTLGLGLQPGRWVSSLAIF